MNRICAGYIKIRKNTAFIFLLSLSACQLVAMDATDQFMCKVPRNSEFNTTNFMTAQNNAVSEKSEMMVRRVTTADTSGADVKRTAAQLLEHEVKLAASYKSLKAKLSKESPEDRIEIIKILTTMNLMNKKLPTVLQSKIFEFTKSIDCVKHVTNNNGGRIQNIAVFADFGCLKGVTISRHTIKEYPHRKQKQQLDIWNLSTGMQEHSFSSNFDISDPPNPPKSDLLHTSERLALFQDDNGIKAAVLNSCCGISVWDVTNGKFLYELELHRTYYNDVAVYKDHKGWKALALASLGIDMWDLEKGTYLCNFKLPTQERGWRFNACFDAYFDNDSLKVIVSNEGIAVVCDLLNGECLQTLPDHNDTILDIMAYKDAKGWKCVTWTQYEQKARIWDLATGQHLSTFAQEKVPPFFIPRAQCVTAYQGQNGLNIIMGHIDGAISAFRRGIGPERIIFNKLYHKETITKDNDDEKSGNSKQ